MTSGGRLGLILLSAHPFNNAGGVGLIVRMHQEKHSGVMLGQERGTCALGSVYVNCMDHIRPRTVFNVLRFEK